jgi:hypothetical protein
MMFSPHERENAMRRTTSMLLRAIYQADESAYLTFGTDAMEPGA